MFLRQVGNISKNTVQRNNAKSIVHKSAKTVRQEFLDFFVNNLNHTFVHSSPVFPLFDPTVPFVNAGMNQEEACRYAWQLLTDIYGINKDFLYVTYFSGNEKFGLQADLECKDIWLNLGVAANRILPFGMEENFWEMGVTGPCGPCTEIHIDHTMNPKNQAEMVNKGHTDLTELWNIVFIQHQRLTDGSIIPLAKQYIDTGMGLERLVAVLQRKRSNYDTDLFTPLFEAIQKKSHAPEYEGRFAAADKDGIDSGYRILADHARMVTVAIADGTLPEENYKLRKVLRKALDVSENVFKQDGLLLELTFHIAEILGDVYPEIRKNLTMVQRVIQHEDEVLKNVKCTAEAEWKKIVQTRPSLGIISDVNSPGLVAAYKDLQTVIADISKSAVLPVHVAFKLYDTYGLSVHTIAELAKVESLSFDESTFYAALDDVRQHSRFKIGNMKKEIITQSSLTLLEQNNTPKTDDSPKYEYTYTVDKYCFSNIKSKLVAVIINGNVVPQNPPHSDDESTVITEATVTRNGNIVEIGATIEPDVEIGLILDKTPYYTCEGGQASDTGYIQFKNLRFNVNEVYKLHGYVIHVGKFAAQSVANTELELRVGVECVPTIDTETRVNIMRHHTATHLLHAALRQVMPVVRQRSCTVTKENLTFTISLLGEELSFNNLMVVQDRVNDIIKANVPVNTRIADSLKLLSEDDLVLVPGEIYPLTGIRIVEINDSSLTSKEACCGTHVHNTGVLQYFCILDSKSKGTGRRAIKAVAGPFARLARLAGDNVKAKVDGLEKEFEAGNIQHNVMQARIHDLKRQIASLNSTMDNVIIPYSVKQECLNHLYNLQKSLKSHGRSSAESEMKNAMHSLRLPFMVQCLQSSTIVLNNLSLPKLTNLCPNMPVMVIVHSEKMVKARCCIPKEMVSNDFNARSWMKTVVSIFNSEDYTHKDEDPLLVNNMKSTKLLENQIKSFIDQAVTEATKFASKHVKKTKHKSK
ncbi:alanine--tRNA ligase, mitochondrial isoform X2 [Orussus abietinus]|uniref:alanine--tRNA ligase, mitochondrial isoform X2 n=1 Tax=Orussus abietinus TaxID=222816 RepID=UPI00062600BC|nr:alanine--tRNA ligase, mitochondrial isoform X2 [Orussus abietinus]